MTCQLQKLRAIGSLLVLISLLVEYSNNFIYTTLTSWHIFRHVLEMFFYTYLFYIIIIIVRFQKIYKYIYYYNCCYLILLSCFILRFFFTLLTLTILISLLYSVIIFSKTLIRNFCDGSKASPTILLP